ncbi:DUF3857 domain-containing protein [Paludibacter jiangxiensis]|uniref:Transglutaminase-like superfamily protein n=1 Tax=Paludibacter jiangxiensis TaxID=681398 RepID=A0A161M668_9BACT|nr:DUF3857 domain-containing protein [Paludibacter jiangxiensis]GAT64093.1 transglutaminase-like superfamily protein [Paludibacter jiangxiensis]
MWKSHFVLIAFLFGVFVSVSGAETLNYPVSQIPDSLKTDAYSVVRYESTHFEYYDQHNGLQKVIRVVTILDEKGKDEADFFEGTGQFWELKKFSGEVYDANGKLVKKIRNSDLITSSFSQEVASDEIKNIYSYSQPNYPYTIKYEYEIKFKNGIVMFPVFAPVHNYNQSLQNAEYFLQIPKGVEYNVFTRNFAKEAVKTSKDGSDVCRWESVGFKAIDEEPVMAGIDSFVPLMMIKPCEFAYDKFIGSLNSWSDVGKFEWSLLKDRDVLPDQFVEKLKGMVSGLASDKEKVKKIFEFLQKSTRYVSIQLGVGGWQPIAASSVYQTGFGDCKGLSNYLRAMLKAVGIESYFTIIYSGDKKQFMKEFATPAQFNHAILTVPFKTDTIPLECTSQYTPFGYVHDNIAGHNALLVTPEGGKLYKLPQYADTLSYTHKCLQVSVDKNGMMKANVQCGYEMHEFREMLDFEKNMNNDERVKDIKSDFHLPNMTISDISCVEKRDALPRMTVKYKLNSETYAAKSGTRMFCPVNPLKNSMKLFSKRSRKYPFVFENGGLEYDTIQIALPEGVRIESCPSNVSLKKPFGSFYSAIQQHDGKLMIIQKINIKRGTYPANMNNEMKDFILAINNAFSAQIVLKTD